MYTQGFFPNIILVHFPDDPICNQRAAVWVKNKNLTEPLNYNSTVAPESQSHYSFDYSLKGIIGHSEKWAYGYLLCGGELDVKINTMSI